MSHFTTIAVQITDIDALRDACTELNLNLTTGGNARGYAGQEKPGDYVIRLNGPYDVAVVHSKQHNRYDLVTDTWAGHVERELGKDFGRLKQLYGVHKAIREARSHGYHVRRQQLHTGAIRLALSTC